MMMTMLLMMVAQCSPRKGVSIESIGIHLVTSSLACNGAVTCSKSVTIPEKCENFRRNFSPATKSVNTPGQVCQIFLLLFLQSIYKNVN